MKTAFFNARRHTAGGFSLPEVAIAVAITALGLTSVLGLVPSSLDTMRQAGNVAAESRITQQVLASVTSAEWTDTTGANLLESTFQGRRYYFDDEAVELDSATTAEAESPVTYVAEVEVTPSEPVDPYLRRVKVKVTNASRKEFNFATAKPASYRAYTSLVSRNGR